MKITYNRGTRQEYAIGITKVDEDTVLLTSMPLRGNGTSNGFIVYQTLQVLRSEMTGTWQCKVDLWDKCGIVGHRRNNREVVPVICELFGIDNPENFIYDRD